VPPANDPINSATSGEFLGRTAFREFFRRIEYKTFAMLYSEEPPTECAGQCTVAGKRESRDLLDDQNSTRIIDTNCKCALPWATTG